MADANDNCPLDANPSQEDFEGNGLGDACDLLVIPPDQQMVPAGEGDEPVPNEMGEDVPRMGCSVGLGGLQVFSLVFVLRRRRRS